MDPDFRQDASQCFTGFSETIMLQLFYQQHPHVRVLFFMNVGQLSGHQKMLVNMVNFLPVIARSLQATRQSIGCFAPLA